MNGSEKRFEVRHETVKNGTVVIGEGSAIDVIISDLSETGARLVVPDYKEYPSTFELSIEHQALPVLVRKCWQSAQNIGVRFLPTEHAIEAMQGMAQYDGSETHDGRLDRQSRTDQTRSQSAEAAALGFLIPEYEMQFNSALTEIEQGYCSISLRLRNFGDTGAIYPFICLPALGFRVEPAKGWVANEIVNVRKVIRFGAEAELMLQPEAAVHCCNMILPFSPRDGGYLTFTSDIVHPFTQLPSIPLNCQVGAANFPAERHTLTIPASHIAGLILDHIFCEDSPLLAAEE